MPLHRISHEDEQHDGFSFLPFFDLVLDKEEEEWFIVFGWLTFHFILHA